MLACENTNGFSVIIGNDILFEQIKSRITNQKWTITTRYGESEIKLFNSSQEKCKEIDEDPDSKNIHSIVLNHNAKKRRDRKNRIESMDDGREDKYIIMTGLLSLSYCFRIDYLFSSKLPRAQDSERIKRRIPFYFSSLYPLTNQLNSLKNPRVKSEPTIQLESQMLIKLAKMIWKATKKVQN